MYKLEINPGNLKHFFDKSINEFNEENILERIWDHDHTVWADEENEIANRLGWLTSPNTYFESINDLQNFANEVRTSGITDILLLGMGGSSLAPEVFNRIFGNSPGFPKLQIIDSTAPGTILARQNSIKPETSLFIIATKSGGTIETLSFFKYFYNWMANSLGEEKAGNHFVAITDPDSKLEKLASEFGFRKIFINDPNIGGRYSALSLFGLVPAALIGIDLKKLLNSAIQEQDTDSAVKIGIMMGEAANAGKDKLTIITSQSLSGIGDWAEQLIAESTGKNGKGILPIVGELLGKPDKYQNDRLFVQITLEGEKIDEEKINVLQQNGHPVIKIELKNKYALGAQFFLWEMATAIASWLLEIHPFNQPNVESAKILARDMVSTYHKSGQLPEGKISKFDKYSLVNFLDQLAPFDYVSIHGYLTHNDKNMKYLHALQTSIQDKYKVATTVGFGPRFLHSTGQLHKGDRGNGLFIQIISNPEADLDIPDEPGISHSQMTFGVLMHSQALGDAQALRNENRRIISFEINESQTADIENIMETL